MNYEELRKRLTEYVGNADKDELFSLAHILGIENESMQSLESSYSGDYLDTVYGRLTHTNGHFQFERIDKTFWFHAVEPHIARQTSAGSPSCCSMASFNVPLVEKWASEQGEGDNP